MQDFLKKKNDKSIEELKKKYFDESEKPSVKYSTKPTSQTFSEQGELENYIQKQKINR